MSQNHILNVIQDLIKSAELSTNSEAKKPFSISIAQVLQDLDYQNEEEIWEAGNFVYECARNFPEHSETLYNLAYRLYSRAADKKYPSALRSMGQLYMLGLGVPTDREKAFLYYQEAAALGNEAAFFDICRSYFLGCGVEKDIDKAIELLSHKVEEGDAEAMHFLGRCYFTMNDSKNAYAWWKKAAENGSHEAAFSLSYAYLVGPDEIRNPKKGVELLKRAAEAVPGVPEAQFHLALLYLRGNSEYAIEKDISKGIEWLKKSADGGSFSALGLYGRILFEGKYIDQDIKLGIRLMESAGEHDDATQIYLSSLYCYGTESVEADYEKGAYWANKAVENGSDEAMLDLAMLYLDGLGVQADEEKALALIKRSAAAGNEDAKYILTESEAKSDE